MVEKQNLPFVTKTNKPFPKKNKFKEQNTKVQSKKKNGIILIFKKTRRKNKKIYLKILLLQLHQY